MSKLRISTASSKWKTSNHEIVIISDLLRACTLITAALYNGAKSVIPTSSIMKARALARKNNALLIGERKSYPVKGFDVGNSPSEMKSELIQGKKIILTTTNFPKTFESIDEAPIRLVGSLGNASAISEYACELAVKHGFDICLAVAGEPDESNEDYALIVPLANVCEKYEVEFDREIHELVNTINRKGIVDWIRKSTHALTLISLGFQKDVDYACRIDNMDIIPIAVDHTFVKVSDLSDDKYLLPRRITANAGFN